MTVKEIDNKLIDKIQKLFDSWFEELYDIGVKINKHIPHKYEFIEGKRSLLKDINHFSIQASILYQHFKNLKIEEFEPFLETMRNKHFESMEHIAYLKRNLSFLR